MDSNTVATLDQLHDGEGNAVGRVWGGAIVLFGAGDLVTTLLGLSYGARERNPLPATLAAQVDSILLLAILLVAWKLAVLAGCYVVFDRIDSPVRFGIPLGLAVVGVLVVGWNLRVLAAL